MEKANIFKCKPPEVHFTIRNRVPYNKQLTDLACSSRTVECWPSVIFVRTSLHSVSTITTSVQYSPVRPLCSVSKRLVLNLCQLMMRKATMETYFLAIHTFFPIKTASCKHKSTIELKPLNWFFYLEEITSNNVPILLWSPWWSQRNPSKLTSAHHAEVKQKSTNNKTVLEMIVQF